MACIVQEQLEDFLLLFLEPAGCLGSSRNFVHCCRDTVQLSLQSGDFSLARRRLSARCRTCLVDLFATKLSNMLVLSLVNAVPPESEISLETT